MKIRKNKASDKTFWIFIFLAILLGVFLRLYLILGQILLNDEWHSMYFVIDRSFLYLFTNFSLGANSIPMNLYRWFLLKTLGWSELLLRLPSLLAGILSLIIFPVFMKRIFNYRITIIFAFLCAISPFLIFYSRLARPYSIVVFLSFVSVLSLYFWAKSAIRNYAVLYVVTAVGAVYFHSYAAVTVLTPLASLFLIKLIVRDFRNIQEKVLLSFPALIAAAFSIILLLSILLLPAYLKNRWWMDAAGGMDFATQKTLGGFACLLSGTANKFMMILFIGLLCLGQLSLFTKKPLLANMFFYTLILYYFVIALNRQYGIHAAIQVARYSISAFPICFALVAIGADRIVQYLQCLKPIGDGKYRVFFANLLATTFLVFLFFSGPLTKLYVAPNNFTNHSFFQESYEAHAWEQSYTSDLVIGNFIMNKSQIPKFYFWLSGKPDIDKIIEYPMNIGDNHNLYYYYQHFHKKKVIVGYSTELVLNENRNKDFVYGNWPICAVFSSMTNAGKLKFRNIIEMNNIRALRISGADYIILHKNLLAEMFPQISSKANLEGYYLPGGFLRQDYEEAFGQPAFEDQNLIVFKISPNTKLN